MNYFILPLLIVALNTNLCQCLDKYYCEIDDVELEEVNGQYGPLCDGRLDCRGGKDEMYCDYEKARYTGCWSLSYDGTDNHYTIANCTQCLCIADVDHCSDEEFLGRHCGKCITDERMIGDGRYDCVHGVDEAADAISLKEDGFDNWKKILNGATWMCRDPNQNEVVKRCGAVLSNKRRPFLHSFTNNDKTYDECDSVESFNGDKLDFWYCPTGQCVRDKNHCEGQCPWGFEYDRYLGNCKQLECLDHQRICDNSCIVETRSCHGLCPDGKYFCHEDGWCRDPREPCGQNQTCTDNENYHFCPETGLCQLNNLVCGDTCLAPGMMLCHTTGTCLHLGTPSCSEWCPGRQRLCGDRCIKLTEPCEGTCSVGYWHCLEFSNLCIPRYKQCGGNCYELDEPCLDQIGRMVCFPKGTCPVPLTTSTLTTTSTTTTTTSTTSKANIMDNDDVNGLIPQSSVSECDEQICYPNECDSPPCLGVCTGLNQTCHGLCLPGRKLCRDVCIPKSYDCPDDGPSPSFSFMGLEGVPLALAVGASCALLASTVALCCLIIVRLSRNKAKGTVDLDRSRRRRGGTQNQYGSRPEASSFSGALGEQLRRQQEEEEGTQNRYRRPPSLSTFEMVEPNMYYGED